MEVYYSILFSVALAIIEIILLVFIEKVIGHRLLITKKQVVVTGVVVALILGSITLVELYADTLYFNNKGVFDIVDNTLFCFLLSLGWFVYYILWRGRKKNR